MKYTLRQRINPLDRTAEPKYYAAPKYGEEVDIRMLAEDISKSCTLTPADIRAVIESLIDRMPFYLKNSNKIRLDGLGIFKLSFSSEGKEKSEDVTAKDIKNLKVIFTPNNELRNALQDITFTKK